MQTDSIPLIQSLRVLLHLVKTWQTGFQNYLGLETSDLEGTSDTVPAHIITKISVPSLAGQLQGLDHFFV